MVLLLIIFDFVSFQGYTPLHLAAMQGHEHIIELLVQAYGKSCHHLKGNRKFFPELHLT